MGTSTIRISCARAYGRIYADLRARKLVNKNTRNYANQSTHDAYAATRIAYECSATLDVGYLAFW